MTYSQYWQIGLGESHRRGTLSKCLTSKSMLFELWSRKSFLCLELCLNAPAAWNAAIYTLGQAPSSTRILYDAPLYPKFAFL